MISISVGVFVLLLSLHNFFSELVAKITQTVQINPFILSEFPAYRSPRDSSRKSYSSDPRYYPCLHTADMQSWSPRCAIGISEFLNAHICMASRPDVAPQRGTKSRAFHHSNSSKRRKPETDQVEQVWKLFLACLCDSIQTYWDAVKPECTCFLRRRPFSDLQCWGFASLFTVKSLAWDAERNQGDWIVFANYSCLLWWEAEEGRVSVNVPVGSDDTCGFRCFYLWQKLKWQMASRVSRWRWPWKKQRRYWWSTSIDP